MAVGRNDGAEKQPDVGLQSELISRSAEVFRSKMVHEFNLFETAGDGLDSAGQPHLFTTDVTDEQKAAAMMISEPSSLIQFKVYSKVSYFISQNALNSWTKKLLFSIDLDYN